MWPMLITRTLGREDASTILGGVVELTQLGSYGVAFIVFFASIVIPVAKFAAIAVLGWRPDLRRPALRYPSLSLCSALKRLTPD